MKEKTKAKSKKTNLIIYFLLTILIVLSVIYIINFFSLKQEAKSQSNLLNTITEEIAQNISEEKVKENNGEVIKKNEETVEQEEIDEQKEEPERMLQVKQLQEQNADIVGWLEIENTNINYPVLQGTDNSYYMTHNYKKEKSKNGSIFLDANYNWNISSNNLLIYGHNLGNGMMFQELLKYEKQSFYKKHPNIRFTTADEDAEYEIISVFKSRVYYKSERNVFRYYYFINSKSEIEYNDFVKNAKNASLYPIDATANYGDQLITLSTCSYYVEDGRFAVVGKRIEQDSK